MFCRLRRQPLEKMTEKENKQAQQYAAELLELFYPIHYRGNMAVEDAMRGPLPRKEAAIIWLIRSAGGGGLEMRGKQSVGRRPGWVGGSNPAGSKCLRHMIGTPLRFVRFA